MLKFKSILLLFAIQAWSFGQQFNFKKYGLEEGLPRVGVYDIFQDDYGFLWIGTEGGGVCKFDGKTFHSYTRKSGLPSDNIRLLYQSKDKTLWCATDEGVCYFNGNSFTEIELIDSNASDRIRSISEDESGRIWIGTDHGVNFINSFSKTADSAFNLVQEIPDSTVRALMWIENKMWVGTDSGLYIAQNNKLELSPFQQKLNSFQILELFVDSDKNIWIGTNKGVCKIEDSLITSFGTSDGLINSRVRSIEQDDKGNMWFGTSRGISIYDGELITNITQANGLTNERIRCIKKDSFGNVWVGTFYGGILSFNYRDFIGFTVAEGLGGNQIQSICEDEYGDILVGTSSGFTTLEVVGNRLYNYSTVKLSDNYLTNSIKAIHYDKNGYVWLGNLHGMTIVKGDFKKEIVFQSTDPDAANVGVTVIKEYGNKIYAGTSQGLFQIKVVGNYESFEIINLSEGNRMAGEEISSVFQDKEERIWIGFSDGQVSVFDKTRMITPVVSEDFDQVISITADSSGTLYFGTDGNGLFTGTYDSENKNLQIKNFSTVEGLTSNYIYSIILTPGKIWLGHERGVDILVTENDSVSNIIKIGSASGFKGLQNHPNAGLKDSNGNIWFGTIDGLYRLSADQIENFLLGTPSKIYLTDLKLNGQNVNWASSKWCDTTWGMYNLPVNLNLPYNKNNLEFNFIGLNFVAPDAIKYSWKLEGLDEDWSVPASENHVLYNHLAPGIYTFKVRASNELGIIQENEESITFIIHKPFWETWWFRIFAGIFIFICVVIFLRWRTRQLRENQKKLEAIITQRTTEIKSQNEMLEEKNKEITDSIFYSRRIQRSVLPAKEKVAKLLSKYFIFFRPKDIVSGDFYWAEKSLDRTKTFFAVADCTGHGVPGAMVSLIGSKALTSAVRESGLTRASEILDAVNESMIESFTEVETGNVIKDGMDIALCSLDYSDTVNVGFQFSGAQNSVWIVRKEDDDDLVVNSQKTEANISVHGYKLFEIKADKQPIGYFETRVLFRNNEAVLKPGDRIYLYSDGFADQFGGDKGKKFKYKTLKELVLSIQQQPVEEHYQFIRNAFYDWKREFEQIDDVCIMGVEV